VVNSGKEEEKKSERSNREKKKEKFLISEDMKPSIVGQDKGFEPQVKSKIAFKPKRSYLIERRDEKSAEK
jgi:hypothetical protein